MQHAELHRVLVQTPMFLRQGGNFEHGGYSETHFPFLRWDGDIVPMTRKVLICQRHRLTCSWLKLCEV